MPVGIQSGISGEIPEKNEGNFVKVSCGIPETISGRILGNMHRGINEERISSDVLEKSLVDFIMNTLPWYLRYFWKSNP